MSSIADLRDRPREGRVRRALMLAAMLATAALVSGLPASADTANGSRAGSRENAAEYRDALRRADKDYDQANRRCEVLAIDERVLCRNDSARARRAAVAEARAKLQPEESRTTAATTR
ncbi:MAG TPA: hypothetical protein VFB01_15850 [Burkholderiales bacterium]|nr:hypothetical protein [Burkholderiales bacterium]